MPDLMSFLRLKNLFGQPQVGNDLPSQGGYGGNLDNTPDFSQLFAPKVDPYNNITIGPGMDRATPATNMSIPNNLTSSPEYDPGRRMKELYSPETTEIDRFNELSNNYPDREKYKPSMLRRIGAGLVAGFGRGGAAQGLSFKNAPFNEALLDWKTQMGPAQQAASLERQNNINERTTATQTISQELKQRDEDKKSKIANDKLELQRLKDAQGNFKFDYSGPKVMISDPKTGKVFKTDIDTGSLSEIDKLEKQQANAMALVDNRGQEARQTNENKGWQPVIIPDPNDPTKQITVRMNVGTGEVQPITLGGKNLPPVVKPGTPGKTGGLSGTMTAEQLTAIQEKTQETLDVLNELQDEKTGKLNPKYTGAIGASRMFGGQYIPGTQTRGGEVAINRLKSLLIVDLIAEMKKQSRTGATGFGQLNAKELGVLEGAASKLDPSLDEPTFNAELSRVREKLKKILQPADGLTPTTLPKGGGTTKTPEDYWKEAGGR